MGRINRRTVLLSASAFVAAPRIARAADIVRFGVLHPNLTTVIHAIAKKTGAYERHNLNVVETKFKSGQTVEGVEQLWRERLDFYMGGAPEVPRLNSRLIESGRPAPLAVVSGANPGHTSLVLSSKLQPKVIDEILSTLALLNKEGLPIVLVEQKAPLALRLSSRAYLLSVGRLIAEIDPRIIKSHDELARYYLS